MELVMLPLLAIVGLAAYVFQEGRDALVQHHSRAQWIMIAALLPLGALIGFSLLLGIGEMLGGVPGGPFHLLFPTLPIVILAWLAWRRPGAGGVTLMLLGTLLGIAFFGTINGDAAFKLQAALVIGAPFVTSGALFLSAAIVARSRAGALHH
jgi:hypothetical protein